MCHYTNQANVTFVDSYNNPYSSTSNNAIVTVAQVYSATITNDRNVTASAGQTVYLSHILTNTGNGTDTYTLNFAQDLPGGDSRGTDTIDATNLELIWDQDGDGVAEAGEPVLVSGDTIDLDGAQIANLLLKVVVPTTATLTDTVGVTLTATSANSTVTDIGDNNDSADGTNADLISITNDAVLNMTKSATQLDNVTDEATLGIDVDGDTTNNLPVTLIRYTVTVTNNGSTAAKEVNIFDGVPDGTFLVSGTGTAFDPDSNGLWAVNNDQVALGVNNIVDEASHPLDLDHDGTNDTAENQIASGFDFNNNGTTTDTTVPGVIAKDAQLNPGTTISMTFHAAYSPSVVEGGTTFENTAYSCADLNGDGDYVDAGECNDPDPTTAGPDTTNKTTTESTETVGVDLIDTGTEAGTSGGGDSDGTADDVQTVAGAAAGSEVFFYNKIVNTGNKVDSFDLATTNVSFPAGTTFEYWTSDGTAQLVNTNSVAAPDTGPVQPATCTDADVTIDGITVACNEFLFRVVAKLPSSAASDPVPFDATTTATSFNDSTQSASKTERLASVTGPTVDLANTAVTSIDPNVDIDPVDVSDGFDAADVATVFNDEPYGSTVNVPLYIANEGGSSDSFILTSEGSYNGATWEANIPTGWSVVFKHAGLDTNADGTIDLPATGDILTSTPTIPAGGVLWIVAEVTIPNIPVQALADSDQTAAIDANTDGDLDYIISFVAESSASGAKDRKVEAFDVSKAPGIQITPTTLSNQVEKNGRVDYEHTLTNAGNTTETVDLSSANDKVDFNNTIRIDVDGDGSPDIEIGNLCNGTYTSPIQVQQPDTSVATIEFACDSATDTVPSLTLEPGEQVPLLVTVFAPSDASENTVNITTITAVSTTDPTVNASATDVTTIVEGQIRLRKFADIDTGCTGTPDADKSFLRVETSLVEPQQCIIWKLVAINEGDKEALNVVISDKLTDYTEFLSGGSLVACQNSADGGTIVLPADATYPLQVDDEGPLCMPSGATGAAVTSTVTGNSVTFSIASLASGDTIVAHFSVRVK